MTLIIFVNPLPKTRSGKIMRRLLRNIVRNEETTGDLSTLDNSSVIDEIKQVLLIMLGDTSVTPPLSHRF